MELMSRSFRRTLLSALIVVAATSAVATAAPPNVLIIMADDCTYNDLPAYGGQNARTPNIDALAQQGLVFNKAYLASAMCQPCRAELFSGQYPMQNGCAWNHSASRPETTSMPQHLGGLGYRVGLAGKVHVKPAASFPFETVAGFESNCVRNPTRTHNLSGVREFIARDESPFCLVVALVEPHVPWVMGDASTYPPETIILPPNIVDTQRTRADFGSYLAEITYMDGQVGEILAVLDESGRADDTLVLFTSEQGSQFPGCKWTNWDTGLHTALIARWPDTVKAGQRTDALVQYCDVLPTLLDAAGSSAKESEFNGVSFLRVLTDETAESRRKYAYGMHNNLPEGPAYPIRTVTDGEFRYIRNLTPGELYIEKHLMGVKDEGRLNNPYWATWIWDSQENQDSYNLVKRYMSRPGEQLYHTAKDSYELTDRTGDVQLSEIRSRLSTALDQWMAAQGDPGVRQDTMEALQAARHGRHLYFPR